MLVFREPSFTVLEVCSWLFCCLFVVVVLFFLAGGGGGGGGVFIYLFFLRGGCLFFLFFVFILLGFAFWFWFFFFFCLLEIGKRAGGGEDFWLSCGWNFSKEIFGLVDAESEVTEAPIRELLIADDAALTSHTEDGRQQF